jgi:hypothetical protein
VLEEPPGVNVNVGVCANRSAPLMTANRTKIVVHCTTRGYRIAVVFSWQYLMADLLGDLEVISKVSIRAKIISPGGTNG